MKGRDLWRLSAVNVYISPVRSLLTVLGMAVGVGAVLAVLTLGAAGRDQVRMEMGKLGIDKVWLTSQEGNLRQGDAEWLMQSLGSQATEQIYLPAMISKGNNCQTATVVGCTADYLSLCGIQIEQGRSLWPQEWQSRCVLVGESLAKRLQVRPDDVICIEGVAFRVCGVTGGGSAACRVNVTQCVIAPLIVLKEWTGGTIHEIVLDVPKRLVPQTAGEMAQALLARQNRRNVAAVNLQLQMDAANSVIDIFVNVLKWVALVCVLVGGIGVMNILLISVRERRREIGVMKSLGATQGQIRRLFLLEAFFYAAAGALLGLALGFVLIDIAGKSIGLVPHIRWADCALVAAAALGVGLVFGVAPAARAASLHPVDALRSE